MKIHLSEANPQAISFNLVNSVYVPEQTELVGLPPGPQIDQGEYRERLKELNETFDHVKDEETGLRFEVGAVNVEKIGNGNETLFGSTRSSSLTTNRGNAVEFAGRGAANPNTPSFYVAWAGNGYSTSLHGEDQKQFRKTGRLTTVSADGQRSGLTHMEAAVRTVSKHFDVQPKHASTDESGGRFVLGMMAAAEKDSFVDAYLNGVNGISKDISYGDLKMTTEDMQGRPGRGKSDEYQPGKANDAAYEEAMPLLPNIYKGLGFRAIKAYTYARIIPNQIVNSLGFNRHNDLSDLDNHALFFDTVSALHRQEALITLQAKLGSEQKMEAGLEDIIKFGQAVMSAIPEELRSEHRGVEFMVSPDKLDAHTDNPLSRYSAEHHGLRSIATFMRLVFAGNPDTMVVTTVEQPKESWAA